MMSSFLNFLISHNESIIQWLIVSIVAISGYLLAIMIFGDKKNTDEGIEASTAELKNTLTEILKNTGAAGIGSTESISGKGSSSGQATAAGAGAGAGEFKDVVPPGAAVSGAGGAYGADLEKLKKDLSEKQIQITKLQAELEGQKNSAKSDGALEEKLKELEAKLAEYQILEDDIADLSAYKEENARLKSEIQKLGGAAPADPAAASPAAAPDVSAPSESDRVATAALPDKPDDFVAEFEAAVEIEKSAKESPEELISEEPTPIEAATEPAAVEPAPNEAATEPAALEVESPAPPPEKVVAKTPEEEEEEIAESIGDDIFAEFAASIETPEVQDAIRQGLDTDKIMGELADLETAAANDSGEASALEQDIDTDKMASEATKLSGG